MSELKIPETDLARLKVLAEPQGMARVLWVAEKQATLATETPTDVRASIAESNALSELQKLYASDPTEWAAQVDKKMKAERDFQSLVGRVSAGNSGDAPEKELSI